MSTLQPYTRRRSCGLSISKPRIKLSDVRGPCGTLQVTVIQASNLRSVQWLFKQDPYVRVTVGGNHFRTKAIKNGGDRAYWGAITGQLPLHGLEEFAKIEVWNDNWLRDYPIGVLHVPVADAVGTDEAPRWYNLSESEFPGASVVGRVMVAFRFLPAVAVQVLRARGLKRSAQIVGKMDPYCKVKYGWIKWKTEICQGGDCDPEWKYGSFGIPIAETAEEAGIEQFVTLIGHEQKEEGWENLTFLFEVENRHVVGNTFVGSVRLTKDQLKSLANKGEQWMQLYGKPSKAQQQKKSSPTEESDDDEDDAAGEPEGAMNGTAAMGPAVGELCLIVSDAQVPRKVPLSEIATGATEDVDAPEAVPVQNGAEKDSPREGDGAALTNEAEFALPS